MSLKGLKNNPSRNGFDLSFRNAFTAKSGQLLPVMCKECLPGDKFKVNLQWFTRTAELQSSAFTRIKEYYDFFFVPTRLLWRPFDQFVTQMPFYSSAFNGSPSNTFTRQPYITLGDVSEYVYDLHNLHNPSPILKYDRFHIDGTKYDEGGCPRSYSSVRLLDMLGYGDFSSYLVKGDKPRVSIRNVAVSPFPLLAYQKIYSDYYRNDLWENDMPHTYNVDYLTSDDMRIPVSGYIKEISMRPASLNFLDLRYCNLPKDLIMGVMPSPQYGEPALFGFTPGSSFEVKLSGSEPFSSGHDFALNINDNEPNREYALSHWSILALRQAEYLQKWKEISNSGRKDYKEQIEKHFGVHISDIRSNRCEFLGGTSSFIDIDEVVNTALSKPDDAAVIKGKGVGVGKQFQNFEAPEHGFFMCIYHTSPIVDYNNRGLDLQLLRTKPTDYAIPEFDKLGMQELPSVVLDTYSTYLGELEDDKVIENSRYLGYVPRYIDYKTSVDRVHGEFNGDLRSWTSYIDKNLSDMFLIYKDDSSFLEISSRRYAFFKVRPSILDNIFALHAEISDQFRVNSMFNIDAVRSLDRNGLPY